MNYKLREISRKDIKEINKWRNDKELIAFLGAPYRYINEEIDELWYDNYIKNRNNTVRCSIVNLDDNVVGLVTLADIDYINRSSVLHIMIGNNNFQNQGIGKYAIKEMLSHAFMNLNLNRVELEVLSTNERARAVYKKIGFNEEGILRKACFKNGNYVDVIVMAILKEEFMGR